MGTKIRGTWDSTPLSNTAYKRSWVEFSFSGTSHSHKHQKEPKTMKVRKGRPVETAAAVEIDSGGLRQLFLDDFHRCLKKPTQKPLRLFHSYAQARRRLINYKGKENGRDSYPRKCVSCLTEVIHFGNDVYSSVAALRLLDALRWNRWCLSIGITDGIRRNTHWRWSRRFCRLKFAFDMLPSF